MMCENTESLVMHQELMDIRVTPSDIKQRNEAHTPVFASAVVFTLHSSIYIHIT